MGLKLVVGRAIVVAGGVNRLAGGAIFLMRTADCVKSGLELRDYNPGTRKRDSAAFNA